MKAGVRVALASVPVVVGIACAAVAHSAPGPVQPGVTTPSVPAPGGADTPPPAAPAPDSDQPVELHQAQPQTEAPAPGYSRPRPSTPTPEPTPDPVPRTVRVGNNDVQVPDAVPDQVVQGLQNALNPGSQGQQPQ
ncbi:hypothetical protein [Nocardia sp. BMG111209]|uniref:hypothetical protein n=1 Tax=Nocardia sp. BMG111209 TaxID=1160137 RepID=UPI000364E21B|nr:hypothetical protein [Nocardia sp. BMG111209]